MSCQQVSKGEDVCSSPKITRGEKKRAEQGVIVIITHQIESMKDGEKTKTRESRRRQKDDDKRL
jgi:hypothetical protein